MYQSLHLSKSLSFTAISMKTGALSVKPHHNSQKFTDKSAKKSTLSVNLDEILAELGEQRHFFHTRKIKKRLTNSSENRPPSFGTSFNSSKKRDFFPASCFYERRPPRPPRLPSVLRFKDVKRSSLSFKNPASNESKSFLLGSWR